MELSEYLQLVVAYFITAILLKVLWNKRKKIWIIIMTFKRDIVFLYTTLGIMLFRWGKKRVTNETLFKSLDKLSNESPGRTCFLYKNEKWTYTQVQSMSFQVANFFQAQGYRKGDVVGLAMQNRPEVICIWLGLSRVLSTLGQMIGITTALINFNLKGDSLEHCVTASKCKAVIFGSEMTDLFREIWIKRHNREEPQSVVTLYELDRYLDGPFPLSTKCSISSDNNMNNISPLTTADFRVNDFAACLRISSTKPFKLKSGDEEPHFMDHFLYVFTSGTTGKPKAAKCSHSRMNMMGASYAMLQLSQDDVAYCPLPLYHTFSFSAIVWALVYGTPLVIVNKFSASKFWSDMHYFKVTVCLYMGELCRFIVNQPPQPELEKSHSLRKMFGCGVKPEVWQTFINRFNISHFVEAYGSTEGNCTLVNMEGKKIGAFGYLPVIIQPFYSLTVLKVDEITGELIRDSKSGYGIACKDGEPGELVAKIVNFFPSLRYDGYTSKEANDKKIAKDLFRKGDKYFRSGDIVVKDEYGYFYFKDRIGDTFRFKGENVSTAEVEGTILSLTNMKTNIVYGVKIPGVEGRAGMAAISDHDGTLNLDKLAEGLNKELPSYARPVFIRCIKSENALSMTGTFKLQKFNLQKEGFDIEMISDPIFIYNAGQKTYKELDMPTFKQIMQGNYRL